MVTADVSADANGQVVENTVRPNPATGGRRLTLRVNVKDPTKPVELRATLHQRSNAPVGNLVLSNCLSMNPMPSEPGGR